MFKLHSVEPRTDRVRTSAGIIIRRPARDVSRRLRRRAASWLVSGGGGFWIWHSRLEHRRFDRVRGTTTSSERCRTDIGNGGPRRSSRVRLRRSPRSTLWHGRAVDSEASPSSNCYIGRQSRAMLAAASTRERRRGRFARLAAATGTKRQRATTPRSHSDVRSMHTLGATTGLVSRLGARAPCSSSALTSATKTAREPTTIHACFAQLVSNGKAIRPFDGFAGTAPRSLERRRGALRLAARSSDLIAFDVEAGVATIGPRTQNETIVSPRFNASWQPTATTTIRAAWGQHAQSQSVFGLQVEDNLHTFQPAERARSAGIGIDQVTWNGISLRAEAYDREISHLRARYVNAEHGDLSVRRNSLCALVHRPDARAIARGRAIDRTRGRTADRLVGQLCAFVVASGAERRVGPAPDRSASRPSWRFVDPPGEQSVAPESFRDATHGWPFTPERLRVDTIGFGTASPSLWITRSAGDLFSQRAATISDSMRAGRGSSTRARGGSRCLSMFTMCSTTRISAKRIPTCLSIKDLASRSTADRE